MLLVALAGVNVYVFYFRDDTSIRNLMSTGRLVSKEKTHVVKPALAKRPAKSAIKSSP